MNGPGDFQHDQRELAGCPIWVAALFLAGYGLLRVGAAQLYFPAPETHITLGFVAVAAALLAIPLWRRALLLAAFAALLLAVDLGAPEVPFGRLHRFLLVVALVLFLLGRYLYHYLGAGNDLRPPAPGSSRRFGRRPATRAEPDLEEATPVFFRRLGLALPCTLEELKRAYRSLARETHPDLGGDPEAFRQLQESFERAHRFLDARAGRVGRRI